MKQNLVLDKSFDFAVSIVRLCTWLRNDQKEYVLSRQLIRAGTSIGANADETAGAVSRPEFISKMQIACKEARETKYWIRLLQATDFLTPAPADELLQKVEELLRIIGSILISSKSRRNSFNSKFLISKTGLPFLRSGINGYII